MSAPTRRDVLRQLAMAVTAAGSGVFNLEAARLVHAVALEEQQQTGTYALKSLTHHEHATVARLAELIVPADGGGGSAVDAGAPEFIDLLCGQNVELAEIYRGGLAWIDATMRRRSGSTFVDSTPSEQTALLDALVDAEQRGDVAALGPGVEFFGWMRRMTVDAYYTSPIGIADLGYAGNASTALFEVPQDAIDFVNRRIDQL